MEKAVEDTGSSGILAVMAADADCVAGLALGHEEERTGQLQVHSLTGGPPSE